jgi:hypothetical protein
MNVRWFQGARSPKRGIGEADETGTDETIIKESDFDHADDS